MTHDPFAEQRLGRTGDGGSVVNIITMASHGGEPALTAYGAHVAVPA
jgi:tetrahydromethanopterin S-methyltransferase subunit A